MHKVLDNVFREDASLKRHAIVGMANHVFLDQAILQAYQPFSRTVNFVNTVAVDNSSTIKDDLKFSSQHLAQVSDSSVATSTLFLISSTPAFVACCVLIFRAIQYVHRRPRWLQKFIDERTEGQKLFVDDDIKRARVLLPNKLLVLSILGLVTQIVSSLLQGRDLTSLPRALVWVSIRVPRT